MEGAAAAPEATILCNGDSPIFNSKETVNQIGESPLHKIVASGAAAAPSIIKRYVV
jgi:hypothetical protein